MWVICVTTEVISHFFIYQLDFSVIQVLASYQTLKVD